MTVPQLLTTLFSRSRNKKRPLARTARLYGQPDILESRQLLTTLIGGEVTAWATIEISGTETQAAPQTRVIAEESPNDPELNQFAGLFDIDIDGGTIGLDYNLSADFGSDPAGVVPAGTYYRFYHRISGLADRDYISSVSADSGQALVPNVFLMGPDTVVVEIGPGSILGNGYDALINVEVDQMPRDIIGREFTVQNTIQSLLGTSGMEVDNGDPATAVITNGAGGPELQSFNDIYDINVENGSIAMDFNLAPGASDPSGVIIDGTYDRYYFTFALGTNEYISNAWADATQMLVPNVSISDENMDGLNDTIRVETGPGMQIGDTYNALINFDVDIIGSEVSGRKWNDFNNDGIRTPDEPFLNGWGIHLVSKTDPHRMFTYTRNIDLNHDGLIDPATESGVYLFEGVQNGSYYLTEDLPVGWNQSHPVSPVDVAAFNLNNTHNLALPQSNFLNWGGWNEKWLFGSGGWFFTTPDGAFYEWNGESADDFGGDLLEQLSPAVYDDQSLLYDAAEPMHHMAVINVPDAVTGLDYGNYLAPPEFDILVTPETNKVMFTWEEAVPGKRYDIWITDINTGKRHEVATGLTGNTYMTTLPDRRYRVWMRVEDIPGRYSGWSESQEFEFFRDPITPVTDGLDAGIDATPTIQWTAEPDAVSYDVRVVDADENVRYVAYGVAGASHRIATELRLGTYNVNVRANYPDGSRNAWGAGQPLVIAGKPVVQLNANVVSWGAVKAATKYEVWVDQVDASGDRLVRQIVYANDVTDLSYSLPRLPRGNYALWVRAIRSEGGSEYVSLWSDQTNFQVNLSADPENAVDLLDPSVVLTSLQRTENTDVPVDAAHAAATPVETTPVQEHADRSTSKPAPQVDHDFLTAVMEEFSETGLLEEAVAAL